MAEALLEVRGVTKRFGGFTALDGVDFLVRPGERVGLIGPNGSGKSTLVNCIAGTLRNEEGSIRFEGEEIRGHAAHRRIRLGLARSFQIPKPFASMTVLDNLCVPLLYAARGHEKLAPGRIVEEAMRILGQVGLAGRARAMSGGLTQVDMRKLELARAMAAKRGHHDRARDARGDEILRAHRCARGRAQDRRWRPAIGGRQRRSREGLPWGIASASKAFARATARCRCSTAFPSR
jgi:ABC-type lipoprotein export system ATPase subunit